MGAHGARARAHGGGWPPRVACRPLGGAAAVRAHDLPPIDGDGCSPLETRTRTRPRACWPPERVPWPTTNAGCRLIVGAVRIRSLAAQPGNRHLATPRSFDRSSAQFCPQFRFDSEPDVES